MKKYEAVNIPDSPMFPGWHVAGPGLSPSPVRDKVTADYVAHLLNLAYLEGCVDTRAEIRGVLGIR